MISKYIELNEEVRKALDNSDPVLALESTIISHGMPYPENLKVAKELESISRDQGVTPATICLMEGKIKIGLEEEEIHYLATADNVKKVSCRDISRVISRKETGATTVAATMMLAHLAGINVFATGGIGGVHKGGEDSFDISADLLELSRTPVIVVSAGAKAILALDKTLEYLETFSVPVLGFRTDKFPAFYSRDSQLKIEQVNDVSEIAEIMRINLKIGFKHGILVANPVPKEFEIPYEEMDLIIQKAVAEHKSHNISGQNVTPFLLKRIVELTEGRALQTNIELVKNNVNLGAEIAKQL